MTEAESFPRRTVVRAAALTGAAIASGEAVTVSLRPGEAGAGIVFRHLPTATDIPADLAHAAEVPHCTSLRLGEARIDFAEHLLAALLGAGVTDLVVEVDGGEAPLLDGSAAPYWRLLAEAGARDLSDRVEPIVVAHGGFHQLADGKAIIAVPGDSYGYLLDHPHPLIGRQWARFAPTEGDFGDIAGARTFSTEEEARALLAQRELRGASADMAIIAFGDRLSAPQPFASSFAMHKVIDLMGDLCLLGRPLVAQVIGCRTGHADNRALARKIAEAQAT